MTEPKGDPFGLALWALYDREKAERRARPRLVPDDGFPAAADTSGATDSKGITDTTAFGEGARRRAEAALRQLVHGQRNDGLNIEGLKLGHLVGAGLLEHDETAEWLLTLVDEIWPDRDAGNVHGTVHGSLRDGAAEPLVWHQLERYLSPSNPADPFDLGLPVAALDAAAGEATIERTSWWPVDLSGYIDGTHEPVLPSLLTRADGIASLYPGRVHWLSGEPESLKSWLALLACSQRLLAGETVVYVDLEDSPRGMVERLLAMGVTPEVIAAQFVYIGPAGPLSHESRDGLAGVIGRASLLVIDAATEALSMQGLTPKDDVDIARWLELLPRWAARRGPAVLVLDHVVKDAENRGRWATGSQHKLAGLDGIALLVEVVQPGGRGRTGRSRVFVAKDRHGHLGPHVVLTGGKRWFGDLVVDGTGPFVDVVLHAPVEQVGAFRPTVLMARIAEKLVASKEPMTSRDIEDRIAGRALNVRQALAVLVDDGHVEVARGPNNSKLHTLVKPYPVEQQEAA